MITLNLNAIEYYDDNINEFINLPSKTVNFEYSLFAVSKWESKWKIPFLTSRFKGNDPKLIDFYLAMCDDPTLNSDYINKSVADTLSKYIADPQTATTFTSQNDNIPTKTKIFTAEEIYAIMCMNHVPIEFEHRNLNTLLVILRIISVYNNPPKKMSRTEVLSQNRRLNEERKKKYNTRG